MTDREAVGYVVGDRAVMAFYEVLVDTAATITVLFTSSFQSTSGLTEI
jgi:hypothetical protein